MESSLSFESENIKNSQPLIVKQEDDSLMMSDQNQTQKYNSQDESKKKSK